jgi:hypothetical protein
MVECAVVNGERKECRDVERGRIITNASMDFDYCQGNSTIILSFERETGKWSGWKGLAGIWEFGETGTRQKVRGRGRKIMDCSIGRNLDPSAFDVTAAVAPTCLSEYLSQVIQQWRLGVPVER